MSFYWNLCSHNDICSMLSSIDSWVLLIERTRKKIHQSCALYVLMKHIVHIRAKTWPCLWPMDSDRSRTHYVQTYRTTSKRKNECARMITSHPVDLGPTSDLWKRREKRKNRFILYHRSLYNSVQGHRTC